MSRFLPLHAKLQVTQHVNLSGLHESDSPSWNMTLTSARRCHGFPAEATESVSFAGVAGQHSLCFRFDRI